MTLLANAHAAVGLGLPRPPNDFDPLQLDTLLPPGKSSVEDARHIDRARKLLAVAHGLSSNFGLSLPRRNAVALSAILASKAHDLLDTALAASNPAEKERLHRAAAEEFFKAGEFSLALDRYVWLARENPGETRLLERMVRCRLELSRLNALAPSAPQAFVALPLQRMAGPPSANWLGAGFPLLLERRAAGEDALRAVPQAELAALVRRRQGDKTFFHHPDQDRLGLLRTLDPDLAWVVAGSYAVLGSKVKLYLTFTDLGRGTTLERQVQGDLADVAALAGTAYALLGMEALGRARDMRPYPFPMAGQQVQDWCRAHGVLAWQGAEGLRRAIRNGALPAETEIETVPSLLLKDRTDEAVALLSRHAPGPRRDYLLAQALVRRGNLAQARRVLLHLERQRPDAPGVQLLLKLTAQDPGEQVLRNRSLVNMGWKETETFLQLALAERRSSRMEAAYRVLLRLLEQRAAFTPEELDNLERVTGLVSL